MPASTRPPGAPRTSAALASALTLLAACPDPDHPAPPAGSQPARDAPAPSDLPRETAFDPTPARPDPPRDASPTEPAPSDLSPGTAGPTAPLELAFVGDIILGRDRLDAYAPLFEPGEDPFAAVADLLAVDAAIANLETPLMHTRPGRSPIYIGSRFGADKQAARALVGRFAALGVANNHALDLLTDGLRQTPEVLRELGLIPGGAARAAGVQVQVATLEGAGWRVALLAATTWTNRPFAPGDPALAVYRAGDLPRRLLPAVRAARADHDLVVVLLHWGQEYTDGPDHSQRLAARRLLDGGVDLVVGHHPHVLHGLERSEHGLVAYSLGNFLFANTDERSRDSGVLRVRWRPGRRCPERASFHPVRLGEPPGHAPAPATGDAAARISERMRRLSKRLRTRLVPADDVLILDGWTCPHEPDPKAM